VSHASSYDAARIISSLTPIDGDEKHKGRGGSARHQPRWSPSRRGQARGGRRATPPPTYLVYHLHSPIYPLYSPYIPPIFYLYVPTHPQYTPNRPFTLLSLEHLRSTNLMHRTRRCVSYASSGTKCGPPRRARRRPTPWARWRASR